MSKATFKREAQADIDEAACYIAEDAGAVELAFRFIETISDTADLLATQPSMGRERPELAPGLRSFPVGAFVVFYRPTKSGIQVVRVLRGSRDIPSLF